MCKNSAGAPQVPESGPLGGGRRSSVRPCDPPSGLSRGEYVGQGYLNELFYTPCPSPLLGVGVATSGSSVLGLEHPR